eukprot:766157-Pelagomonas_calceolata.AAC.5
MASINANMGLYPLPGVRSASAFSNALRSQVCVFHHKRSQHGSHLRKASAAFSHHGLTQEKGKEKQVPQPGAQN